MKKAYSLREVVDFIPASLHETKNWEIIFYARDPQSGDLRRKRIRVGGIKNKGERRIWAKQMIYSINKKLNDGWNPFIEAESSRQCAESSGDINWNSIRNEVYLKKRKVHFSN